MKTAKLIAKAALFNDKGELLLLRRSKTDKTRPGEMDFVGGSIDPGESPTEAVLREIAEEVGLNITEKDVALVYSATDFYEEVNRVRFLYVGTISGDPTITLSDEHDKYEWLPLARVFERYNHPVWVGGLRYLLNNGLLEL